MNVWRLGDGALVRTFTGHTLNVWCTRFSPDGRLPGERELRQDDRFGERRHAGGVVRTLSGSKQAVVSLNVQPRSAHGSRAAVMTRPSDFGVQTTGGS